MLFSSVLVTLVKEVQLTIVTIHNANLYQNISICSMYSCLKDKNENYSSSPLSHSLNENYLGDAVTITLNINDSSN